MRETSQQRNRRRLTYEGLTQQESEASRKAKPIDERVAAVRRWIDDDDDSACRGID